VEEVVSLCCQGLETLEALVLDQAIGAAKFFDKDCLLYSLCALIQLLGIWGTLTLWAV